MTVILKKSDRNSFGRSISQSRLELFDGDGMMLALNDDWRSTQEAEIIATTVPPNNDLESAIVISFPPSSATTAIVRGKNETTGVALVEVYALSP